MVSLFGVCFFSTSFIKMMCVRYYIRISNRVSNLEGFGWWCVNGASEACCDGLFGVLLDQPCWVSNGWSMSYPSSILVVIV
jgi:hypothetical protein